MLLRLQLTSLKETKPSEYLWRFIFGGTVTVIASLVAHWFGPVTGGLFLAFPGIFPASVSLVEKHKILRESEQGNHGTKSAAAEASVEATGASIGAIGLATFAFVVWRGVPSHGLAAVLCSAFAAWMSVGWLFWWTRERI
jgi:Protein of unknown function (DUF3147)